MNFLFFILMIMLSVAFLTLFERKVLSFMQFRFGPNKNGCKGFIQPISDALKLFIKEFFYLNLKGMYLYSPMLMFFLSMIMWLIYPWIYAYYYIENSIIYLMLVMSLLVYPLMMIGWVSMCNYSILGCLRSVAQMVSFEILLFLMFLIFMMLIEDYSFLSMIDYQIKIKFVFFLYPLYFIFIISMLIDMNRVPFDLVEGESELVSGFNVEYFSSMFVLIFLSEYMNVMFMSLLLTLMFYGFKYWTLLFIFTYMSHLIIFMMIRGVLPRIRYDKLMSMCWIELLMLILFYVFFMYLIKEFFMLINNLNILIF
nr:TPA_asm: ND1 [Bombus trifasciatus]